MRLDDSLFPPTLPRSTGRLDVGDGHELYYEEVGRLDGVPLVVLHGGPGGGVKPYYRQLVDPDRFRGVLYDQRGAGQSTPAGRLSDNTTWHLVDDLERLREHLGVERWMMLGGSWGSTLALAYAERHPESLLALIVTGVFLADEKDRWWLRDGYRFVYPELYEQEARCRESFGFAADDLRGYNAALLDADDRRAREMVRAMTALHGNVLDVWPDGSALPPDDLDAAVAFARITAHYEVHNYFLDEGQLLRDAARLQQLPGAIICGRFDRCTPPRAAFELAKVWPQARLRVTPASGHRWNDQLLAAAVVAEIDRLTPR